MPPRQAVPSNEETLANLNENMSTLLTNSTATKTSLETLSRQSTNMVQLLENVLKQITLLTTTLTKKEAPEPSNPPPPPPYNPPPPQTSLKSPKIHLPSFDDTGPLDWLFQADQYFSFYNIPNDQRVSLASFHFQGEALSWFKYLHNNHLLGDWMMFTRNLELRFGPIDIIPH